MARCLLILALLLVAGPGAVLAQKSSELPLAVFYAKVHQVSYEEPSKRWSIGPLTVRLPAAWKPEEKGHLVHIRFPTGSAFLSFLRATPEARAMGYSVLLDQGRGPNGLMRRVEAVREQCGGEPDVREVAAFRAGRAFALSCSMKEGWRGAYYIEYAMYSSNFLVLLHVAGEGRGLSEAAQLEEVVKSVDWNDEI